MNFTRFFPLLIVVESTLGTSAWAIKAGGINDGLVQDQHRGGLGACAWNLERERENTQIIEYQTLLNSDLRERLNHDSGSLMVNYLGRLLGTALKSLEGAPLSAAERVAWRARIQPFSDPVRATERTRMVRDAVGALLGLNVLLRQRGDDRLAFWSENAVATARRLGGEFVPDHAQAAVDLAKLDETAAMVHDVVRFFTDEFSGVRSKFVFAISGSIGTTPDLLEHQTSEVLGVRVQIELPQRVRYLLFRLKQSLVNHEHAELKALLTELNNYLNLARVRFALEHPERQIDIDLFEC